MAFSYSVHVKIDQHVRRNGRHYTLITSGSETTYLGWDIMNFFWNMSIASKVSMNLLRMSNRSIYEMIENFMKTRPIFQPPHCRDFMGPTDAVYNPFFHEKTKFVTTSGEGSPMCVKDPRCVKLTWNKIQCIQCSMLMVTWSPILQHPTIPYKPTTPIVPTNNPTTLTILLCENLNKQCRHILTIT